LSDLEDFDAFVHSDESDESDGLGHLDDTSEEGDSDYDEFSDFPWLEQMDGKITLKNQSNSALIGSCDCKLIRRSQIRSVFYDDMEEPTSETSELAFDIFDRYGRLRKEFKSHSVKKGTGLWQDEFDNGDLLLFEQLRIDENYRRRGLGQRLFTAVLEMTRGKSESFFAIVMPGYLTHDVEREIKQTMSDEEKADVYRQSCNTATDFWRSLGFRRVGSSSWLALSSDPNHSCHGFPAESDYNPPEIPFNVSETSLQSVDTPPISVAYLLKEVHKPDLEDEKCLDIIKRTAHNIPISDPGWQMTNDDGNTVLHILATASKPKSIEWMISNLPELKSCRNAEGETPLDALEFHLENFRIKLGNNSIQKVFHISDRFTGFSEDAVACLILLKGLTNLSALDRSRLKFGCTCSQCIRGIVSPRMLLALQCQGEIQHDMLSSVTENGPLFVKDEERNALQFVPSRVRENMKTNKSMRQGFAELCLHFVNCVKNANTLGLPSGDNVLHEMRNAGEWPPVSRNFLSRGGTVYSVSSWLFYAAMSQDLFAGDGEHYKVFRDEIKQLPACRNDHEFGFVSSMCGYKRVSKIRYISSWTGEVIDSD
jgi:GNAT superfamily N-acetyltransferase